VLIDHTHPRARFVASQAGRASDHEIDERVSPSIWQYDHLVLRALRADVETLLNRIEPPPGPQGCALDVGAFRSPYKALLESRGYRVHTLDLSTEWGADYAGTAEETGRPDGSVDLLLCTQVLEHTRAPWQCMREFHRILRPGGKLLITVPHVWFYHPHPGDYWRMTQEGVITLCADAGFAVREVRVQGGSLMALAQIVNFLAYGVLGRLGAPLYAAMNLFGRTADAAIPNELFSLNVACLAEKPQ
jgi:SAM-dependent methyltransferase